MMNIGTWGTVGRGICRDNIGLNVLLKIVNRG